MPVAMDSILCKADFLLVDMEPREKVDIEQVDITNSVATLSSGTSLLRLSALVTCDSYVFDRVFRCMTIPDQGILMDIITIII